jgi:hypothetical protein
VWPRGAQVLHGVGSNEKPLSSRKTSVAFSFWAFFYPRPGVLDPALDGGLVALAGATRGFLPAPAEAVQQAANMIAVMAHAETSPDQIGDPLRGPQGRREAVDFRALREQSGKPGQLPGCQFGGPSGPWALQQTRCPLASPPLVPDKDGLARNAQLAGYRRKRLARLQQRQGGQTPRFHSLGIPSRPCGVVSHKPTVPQDRKLSIYLYRCL